MFGGLQTHGRGAAYGTSGPETDDSMTRSKEQLRVRTTRRARLRK